MLKDLQRLSTSLPILPSPTIPSVLFRSSVPTNAFRFHSPLFNPLFPTGIFRDKESIMAIVCSAAEMVFTSGVFITTTPLRVAAGISILSTPTPARPITCRFLAFSIIAAVILVPLRMIQPSASLQDSAFSSGLPFGNSTISKFAFFSTAKPFSVIGSETRIFMEN